MRTAPASRTAGSTEPPGSADSPPEVGRSWDRSKRSLHQARRRSGLPASGNGHPLSAAPSDAPPAFVRIGRQRAFQQTDERVRDFVDPIVEVKGPDTACNR